MIPFNKAFFAENAFGLLDKFKAEDKLFRTREYSARCIDLLSQLNGLSPTYLAKSCTQALELSSLLIDIRPGDEIILPSFAYVSCATSFVLRGARCCFVDIDPKTMNISVPSVAQAISPRTKAIIVINYGGIGCDFDPLQEISRSTGIPIIEDNAMGLYGSYKDRALGTFGDLSTVSFDHLKIVSCGEGGALFINNDNFLDSLKVIYENGTNKSDFIAGKVEKYEWKALGSNYHLSEILSCILFQQLSQSKEIVELRKRNWSVYSNAFLDLERSEHIELLQVPSHCEHNGHTFLIKVSDAETRSQLMKFLNEIEIETTFHYTPLHKSEFGIKSGNFIGEDIHTTKDSLRLLRLPLYHGISDADMEKVVSSVYSFFVGRKKIKI